MSRKVIDKSDFYKDLEPLYTSLHYVAYIDILGTKNIVKNDKDDSYLNDLNNIYYSAKDEVEREDKININDVFIKIFSDNIIFAIKLDKENDEAKLFKILHLVGHMQNRALKKGYLVRGAITKGNFCANELFIHGKALIDAYTMEENNAIYPRIILQDGLGNIPQVFIKQDKDGIYYVDSYRFSSTALVILAKEKLLEMLKRYKNDLKVRQKIKWSISYHNQYVNALLSKNVPELEQYRENSISDKEILIAMKGTIND